MQNASDSRTQPSGTLPYLELPVTDSTEDSEPEDWDWNTVEYQPADFDWGATICIKEFPSLMEQVPVALRQLAGAANPKSKGWSWAKRKPGHKTAASLFTRDDLVPLR